jgi:hypothetical protein
VQLPNRLPGIAIDRASVSGPIDAVRGPHGRISRCMFPGGRPSRAPAFPDAADPVACPQVPDSYANVRLPRKSVEGIATRRGDCRMNTVPPLECGAP